MATEFTKLTEADTECGNINATAETNLSKHPHNVGLSGTNR